MMMLELKGQNFNDILDSASDIVLVDFWATWCGHCRDIPEVLQEICENVSDDVLVCKVNVDAHEHLARYYNVRSVPTVLVFENGMPVKRFVGSEIRNELGEWLGAK